MESITIDLPLRRTNLDNILHRPYLSLYDTRDSRDPDLNNHRYKP